MKTCKTCGKEKDESKFYVIAKSGCIFPECKSCSIARASHWNNANKDKKNENGRRYWHKHKDKLLKKSRIGRDAREYSGNRYKAMIRDNNTCVRCGITLEEHLQEFGEELNVHHKDRKRENNKLSNLETLCLRCHGKEHSLDQLTMKTPF